MRQYYKYKNTKLKANISGTTHDFYLLFGTRVSGAGEPTSRLTSVLFRISMRNIKLGVSGNSTYERFQ